MKEELLGYKKKKKLIKMAEQKKHNGGFSKTGKNQSIPDTAYSNANISRRSKAFHTKFSEDDHHC